MSARLFRINIKFMGERDSVEVIPIFPGKTGIRTGIPQFNFPKTVARKVVEPSLPSSACGRILN
jgi:hypothetical protein